MELRLANRDVVRLWIIGGANNMVRWLEILAAAVFVLEITGSGLAVAAVTAARTLPLLLFGAIAGALGEAIDRKRIQALGMAITAATSATVSLLAWSGVIRPWHLAATGFVAGVVWSTDMSSRRRMVADAAPAGAVARVIALDSLAGALTRMAGPIAGTAAYDAIGLRGAFACSAALSLINLLLLQKIHHTQPPHPLALARLPRDLAEAFAAALALPPIRAVLGVTIVMNLFGFAYTALVAPIGLLVFAVPIAWIGALAAAEPLGSIIGGLALAANLQLSPRRLLLGGAALFAFMLGLMPMAPSFPLACLALLLGGIGLAGFSTMQTTIILTAAPLALRSRMLGLITVCMGTGPFGLLLIGALSDRAGPLAAVEIMSAASLTGLTLVGLSWINRDRAARQAAAPDAPPPTTAASTAQNTAPPPADRRSSAET